MSKQDKYSNSKIQRKQTVYIPKIIHQTYKSVEQLPDHWKNTPDSWREKNKDWKYIFWSDTDCRKLVEKEFPSFLPIFDSYEYPIQRADAIRPILLYVYGGVYVDMDIMCKKAIDDLFYNDFEVYLLESPNFSTITNSFMASKKGARFWIHVLEQMIQNIQEPSSLWMSKHLFVMNTTGPSLLQNAYDTCQNKKDITFLPQSLLFPEECNVCSEKPCSTRESYVTILKGSSWCDSDSEIITLVYCRYKEIIALLCLVCIVYLLYLEE